MTVVGRGPGREQESVGDVHCEASVSAGGAVNNMRNGVLVQKPLVIYLVLWRER